MKKNIIIYNFSRLMITIALLSSSLLITSQQQLVNPGFEIGDSASVDGWLLDQVGSHRETQYVNTGNYSMAVYNWYMYVPGSVTNGDNGLGTPINALPISLSGFYLYDTSSTITSGDSAIVEVFLKNYDAATNVSNTVAYGISKLEATNMSSGFQSFDVIINELVPAVIPDTIVVSLRSSQNGLCTQSNCLYFYVDDLLLNFSTGINMPFNPEKGVDFWPNPIRDNLNINFTGFEQGQLEILNLNGQLVHRQMVNDGQVVNLESLNSGAYMISIEHNAKKEFYKLIKR